MWPFSRDTTMSRRTRSAMEANIVNLSKVTKNLTEVLQHLETQEVLDLFDLSLIKACGTNSQRCIKLYEIILQKNSMSAFRIFMKTLEKTGNSSLIHILLEVGGSIDMDEPHKEPAESIGPSIVGVLVIAFTTSIPLAVFVYMAKTYYDHSTNPSF